MGVIRRVKKDRLKPQSPSKDLIKDLVKFLMNFFPRNGLLRLFMRTNVQ